MSYITVLTYKFQSLIGIKYFMLMLIQQGNIDFLIDGKNSPVASKELFNLLKQFGNNVNIKVINMPFCINNFSFNTLESSHESNLSKECWGCSYAESCKGIFNTKDISDIKAIKNFQAEQYRDKMLDGLLKTYNFLGAIGFQYNEISVYSNKSVLYSFLFKGYDMFFNATKNHYFYLSEHERIYISLSNYSLCSKVFQNSGKNLIFKNGKLLRTYILLMKKLDIDIIFLSGEKTNNKQQKGYMKEIPITFDIKELISYKQFFNCIKSSPDHRGVDIGLKCFLGKNKINFSGRKKIKLQVINLLKKDFECLPNNFVLVGYDTIPKDLYEIISADMILLERESDLSHGFIMSRELKKDCIYGIPNIANSTSSGDVLEIDLISLEIKIIRKYI